MAEDYPADDQNWRGSSPLSLVEEEAVARIARRWVPHGDRPKDHKQDCDVNEGNLRNVRPLIHTQTLPESRGQGLDGNQTDAPRSSARLKRPAATVARSLSGCIWAGINGS